MHEFHPLERREFIKAAAAAAAACSLGACTGRASPPFAFLTAAERETLGAACDRIVPADDFPGAIEAGVVDFLDRQLALHYRDYRALYRLGIDGLDQSAREMHGAALARLDPRGQDDVLHAIEAGRAPASAWQHVDGPVFFRLVIAHTMYGYYGDPRHGGNRDARSWAMVGLPHPPIRGRDRYRMDAAPASKDPRRSR